MVGRRGHTGDAYESIRGEREYQQRKYPEGGAHDDRHTWAELALILGEEHGEATQALKDLHWRDDVDWEGDSPMRDRFLLLQARSELVQVAAVAVALIERCDREISRIADREPRAVVMPRKETT